MSSNALASYAGMRFHDVPKPPVGRCTAENLNMYVRPGEHVHIPCPVHGEHVIHGSSITL